MTLPEQDADLLARLGLLWDRADPVPPQTPAESSALFGLRRLDEELAEMVRDSADEDRRGLLVVRGDGDVRLISFETGPVTVELQVTERGSVRDLVAAVTGTGVAGAEVETAGGRRSVVIEDSLFAVDGVPAGLLRLRLSTDDGRDLVTSWVKV
jgi:hypothetical protein